MTELDRLDWKIIDILQRDASKSASAIGEEVGLSQNACWRRIKRLEEDGILKARVAVFDPERLGYSLTVFATIKVREHTKEWIEVFTNKIVSIPEVVEFYRMSGEVDYMAKILARDIKHYDEIYKQLISIGPILDVSSSFSMEGIKYTTATPILGA